MLPSPEPPGPNHPNPSLDHPKPHAPAPEVHSVGVLLSAPTSYGAEMPGKHLGITQWAELSVENSGEVIHLTIDPKLEWIVTEESPGGVEFWFFDAWGCKWVFHHNLYTPVSSGYQVSLSEVHIIIEQEISPW